MGLELYKKGGRVIALSEVTLEMLGGAKSGYVKLTQSEIDALQPPPVTTPTNPVIPAVVAGVTLVPTYAKAAEFMAQNSSGLLIVQADESAPNKGTGPNGIDPRTVYVFSGNVVVQLVNFMT